LGYLAGLIDKRTMREFDGSCLTMVEDLTPKEIQKIREREGVSLPPWRAIVARCHAMASSPWP
jgi:DNA-binding transcriptional regulator YiaG